MSVSSNDPRTHLKTAPPSGESMNVGGRYSHEGEIVLASSEDLLGRSGAKGSKAGSALGRLGLGLHGYDEDDDEPGTDTYSGHNTNTTAVASKVGRRLVNHNSNDSGAEEEYEKVRQYQHAAHLDSLRRSRTAASSALLMTYSTNAASAFSQHHGHHHHQQQHNPLGQFKSVGDDVQDVQSYDSFSLLTSPPSASLGESSTIPTPVVESLPAAATRGSTDSADARHVKVSISNHNHHPHREASSKDPFSKAHHRTAHRADKARRESLLNPLSADELADKKRNLEELMRRKAELEAQLAGISTATSSRKESKEELPTVKYEDPCIDSSTSNRLVESMTSRSTGERESLRTSSKASPTPDQVLSPTEPAAQAKPLVGPSALDIFRQGIFPMIRAGNVSRLDQFLRAGVFSVRERELVKRASEDDMAFLSSASSVTTVISSPDGAHQHAGAAPPHQLHSHTDHTSESSPIMSNYTFSMRPAVFGEYICTGCTPLHIAAKVGRKDMASVLLAHGADLTLTDRKGRTPAIVARASQHPHLAKFLELAIVDLQSHKRIAGAKAQGPPLIPMSSLASPPALSSTVPSYVPAPSIAGGEGGIILDEVCLIENRGHAERSKSAEPPTRPEAASALSATAPPAARVPSSLQTPAHSPPLRVSTDPLHTNHNSPLAEHAPTEMSHFATITSDLNESPTTAAAASKTQEPELHRSNSMSMSTPAVDNLVRISSASQLAAMAGQGSFATMDIAASFPSIQGNSRPQQREQPPLKPEATDLSAENDCFSPPKIMVTESGDLSQPQQQSNNESSETLRFSSALDNTLPAKSIRFSTTETFPPGVKQNYADHEQEVVVDSPDAPAADTCAVSPPSILSTIPVTPSSEIVVKPESSSRDQLRHQRLIALTSVAAGASIPLPMTARYCTVSDDRSLIICLVGLPGRGKSFMSKRLANYLNWKGIPCKVFNAGDYRRHLLGAATTSQSTFYDPANSEAKEARERMAEMACLDLLKFIASCTFAVGILDATNTTVARRERLLKFFRRDDHYLGTSAILRRDAQAPRIMFLESICRNEEIITENILRAKCGNDDFKTVSDPQVVVKEFRDRIAEYTKVYQPLDPKEDNSNIAYMQIVDIKQFIVLNNMRGPLSGRVAHFLENLHPISYPVFIALPGETVGDVRGIIGGTSVEELLAQRKKQKKTERKLEAARLRAAKKEEGKRRFSGFLSSGDENISSTSRSTKLMGSSPMTDTSDVCSDDDFFQDSDDEDEVVDDEDIDAIRHGDENMQLTERGVLYAKKLQRFLLDRLSIAALGDQLLGPGMASASVRSMKGAAPPTAGSAFGASGRLRILHGTDPQVEKTVAIAVSLPTSSSTTPALGKTASPSLNGRPATRGGTPPPLSSGRKKSLSLHSPIAQAYRNHQHHHHHLHHAQPSTVPPILQGFSAEQPTSDPQTLSSTAPSKHHKALEKVLLPPPSSGLSEAEEADIKLPPLVQASTQVAFDISDDPDRSNAQQQGGGGGVGKGPGLMRRRSRSFIGTDFGEVLGNNNNNNGSFRSASVAGDESVRNRRANSFHFNNTSLAGLRAAQSTTLPQHQTAAAQVPGSNRQSQLMNIEVTPLTSLDDLNYGSMTGMTLSEAVRKHPRHSKLLFGEEVVDRQFSQPPKKPEAVAQALQSQTKGQQKLPSQQPQGLPTLAYTVSFPRGTSCRHVNIQLETAVMHVMRADGPVMVVAAKTPSQGMLAYTSAQLPEKSPMIDLPFGVVMEVGVDGLVTLHKLL